MNGLPKGELAASLAVIGLLGILVMPIPSFALDGLLAVSIGGGILILFLALQARGALDMSTFPSILLLATLFRLAINVASTRRILLEGEAGQVIRAFGEFVVGGQVIVGLVVFAILMVIQFVVITKGSERVAEVAARFTLDALPGKQMAIDADLNAGLIDEPQARQRREAVASEAEFYGAMDGASKFVRGDAIASIIIVAVNLLGGIALGMAKGLPLGEAIQTFAILTVGDALSSQVPALLLSTAAGIVVTKSNGSTAIGSEIAKQVAGRPTALGLAAGVSACLGLVPGLPFIPFVGVGVALGLAARAAGVEEAAEQEREATAAGGHARPGSAGAPGAPAAHAEPDAVEATKVDRVALDLGLSLVSLVDGAGGLVDRIAQARRRIASRLGFVVPVVRIRDDLGLAAGAYRLSLDGVPIARGEVIPEHYLVIAPEEGMGLEDMPGVSTRDPAFGLEARWVAADRRAEAEIRGLAVSDAPSVVVTHLSELLERHAEEILSRDDVEQMVERVKERAPAVVRDLVPELISLGTLQKTLRGLLRERVSIANLPRILEAMADLRSEEPKATPEDYIESVRVRLARQVRDDCSAPDGTLHVITIEPLSENKIAAVGTPEGLDADGARRLGRNVEDAIERAHVLGLEPVVLTRSDIRRRVRDLLCAGSSELAVLSHAEVLGAERIEAVAMITSEEEVACGA